MGGSWGEFCPYNVLNAGPLWLHPGALFVLGPLSGV